MRRNLPASAILIFLLAGMCAACGGDKPKDYGAMTMQPPLVSIPKLLETPELYMGQELTIEGRVFQVCQEMGCWFEVAESSRTLMVDLQMGRHFTVPANAAGMHARVEGKLVRQEGVLKLIGSGVRLVPGAGA